MTNEIKNVPELRFPEFKEGWSKLKLGELAEIVRGSSPRPISDPRWFDINSDIGWLRISDVTEQNGKITKLEQKISKDGQKKTRVLHSKHLLLSIAASVGKPVINYVKTGVHDGFLIFLKPLFDIEFMYQWLDAYRPKWKKYGQPGSQVNLNSELVKSQKIYMPHSVEQKKISDFFSKLDRQIELEEQKLSKLEEQKKGYMQQIFSQKLRFKDENNNDYPEWKEQKLYEVVKYLSSKRSSNNYSENIMQGDHPVYDAIQEISKDVNFDIKEPYISILKDGAGVGRLNLRPGKSSVIGTMGYLLPENIDINFLFYYLKTMNFNKFVIGSTIPHLYFKDYSKETIFVPKNEEEQFKIGSFFIKLDKVIENKSDKIELLKERKKGFLQRMFV